MADTIGSRLREAREKLGKDQALLADDLGIPRNSLHRYENDDQVPGGKVISKMSELGMDIVYILRGAHSLEVKISVPELRLVHNYRMSHKDVKKGVEALLSATARQTEDAEHERPGADEELERVDIPDVQRR